MLALERQTTGEEIKRSQPIILQQQLNPLGLVYVPFGLASLRLADARLGERQSPCLPPPLSGHRLRRCWAGRPRPLRPPAGLTLACHVVVASAS